MSAGIGFSTETSLKCSGDFPRGHHPPYVRPKGGAHRRLEAGLAVNNKWILRELIPLERDCGDEAGDHERGCRPRAFHRIPPPLQCV